jgi:hypothetical protein
VYPLIVWVIKDKVILTCSRSEFMSNRVMNRRGARELTTEEMDQIAAGSNACIGTLSGTPQSIDDVKCNDFA